MEYMGNLSDAQRKKSINQKRCCRDSKTRTMKSNIKLPENSQIQDDSFGRFEDDIEHTKNKNHSFISEKPDGTEKQFGKTLEVMFCRYVSLFLHS